MTIRLNLHRTFKPAKSRAASDEPIEDDWLSWLGAGKDDLEWRDLLSRRAVVVLGEAGMGKTWEFEDQVKRLELQGKPAFFLALNRVTTQEDFRLALGLRESAFDAWAMSNEHGHFFLDAVDEARLTSTAALERALAHIARALKPYLPRVSFVVSCRISDWHLEPVRQAVDKELVAQINGAGQGKHHVVTDDAAATEEVDSAPLITVEVFRLAPLSKTEAKRLAEAHGATPVETFWKDVEDGDYEYMATRPRDLEWMAKRWSDQRMLGHYSELLEAAIANRLSEKNLSYIDAGIVLSSKELRTASERLSAATVFSGRPYVAMPGEPADATSVAPSDVLPEWDTATQGRLLGTALFDEATFGRFKFQHSVRDFLAAHCVAALLDEGLPLREALALFCGSPYGIPVLVNSRRSTLCWLAAIDAPVREYVIRHFPEMLMFEGDPEAWSNADVVDAFRGYVTRLDMGFRPNWWNDLSELRRVARKVPSALLNEYLSRYPDSPEVTHRLLSLIEHGRIFDCANAVFGIYRTASVTHYKRQALVVLATIGTEDHRKAIHDDLVDGLLVSNDLVAAALTAVKFEDMSLLDLLGVFSAAKPEPKYGGGPIERAITEDILPTLEPASTLKLLTAIVDSVPANPMDRASFREETREEDSWKLFVLPDILRRAVGQLEGGGEAASSVLLRASVYVERLRHTAYAKDEDFQVLRTEIELKPALRRKLALALMSYHPETSHFDLIWGGGLIWIRKEELDWLVEQANRDDLPQDERDIWFRLSVAIAFRQESDPRRSAILKTLSNVTGEVAKGRNDYILARGVEYERGRKQQEEWQVEEAARKEEAAVRLATNKAQLIAELERIRDASNFNAIQWLVTHSASRSTRSGYTRVSIESVLQEFGPEIADALDQGLTVLWTKYETPSALDYPSNSVPWSGLIGLASVNHAFAGGLAGRDLSDTDVTKAVQLCVWNLESPAVWFKELTSQYAEQARTALQPWFEQELRRATLDSTSSRTIDLVVRSPADLRAPLIGVALNMLRLGQIPDVGTQRRIFAEAQELRLLDRVAAASLIQAQLARGHEHVPEELKREWLGAWLASDLEGAWRWIQTHLAAIQNGSDAALCIANVMDGTKWTEQLSGSPEEITVLLSLFRFLTPHVNAAQRDEETDESPWHPIRQLRNAIPQVISTLPGTAAYSALAALESDAREANLAEAEWLHSLVVEHSVAEMERTSVRKPGELIHIGEVYCRDPKTERQLLEQVMARLADIKGSIEDGPFSDRLLFSHDIPEKRLQLWLAARLNDTPRRKFTTRFVVHREPQVDADKRTDIEVSARGFKVCIEVKPVGRGRYTPRSLADTLRTQLVGRYLKGGANSRNGVLILFRLDDKAWKIPGGEARGSFPALVEYLQAQATRIRAEAPQIETLAVLAIDCVER